MCSPWAPGRGRYSLLPHACHAMPLWPDCARVNKQTSGSHDEKKSLNVALLRSWATLSNTSSFGRTQECTCCRGQTSATETEGIWCNIAASTQFAVQSTKSTKQSTKTLQPLMYHRRSHLMLPGFTEKYLPMHETPEQLKNPLEEPRPKRKGH